MIASPAARIAVTAAFAAWAAGCASVDSAPRALGQVALANAGFEEDPLPPSCARGWGCSMHADPQSFRFFIDAGAPGAGARSLCIEPVKREPWGEATQVVAAAPLRGKRLRFSVALRIDAVAGKGAGPIAMVHGPHGELLAARELGLAGTRGWERCGVEIDIPAAAHDVEVGVMLEGAGRACLDEARLEILQ